MNFQIIVFVCLLTVLALELVEWLLYLQLGMLITIVVYLLLVILFALASTVTSLSPCPQSYTALVCCSVWGEERWTGTTPLYRS